MSAVPRKTVGFAENMPGNASTYVFRTEATYLGHYRRSLYGVTRKKTGWDSGRHLEIMASGAVPFFVDIDALPPQTLSFYPSELIRRAMALPGVRARAGGADDGRWYLNRENFWVGAGFNVSQYREVAAAILTHARAHLSASAMAAHVLRTMGVDDETAQLKEIRRRGRKKMRAANVCGNCGRNPFSPAASPGPRPCRRRRPRSQHQFSTTHP